MAKRNATELLAGAAVLLLAIGFLGYAVANTGRVTLSGYTLHAAFDHADGLNVGSEVRLAGIKVGSVTGAHVNPQSYRAVVDFTVQNAIKLPRDSGAEIQTDGLLGGKFLNLSPGGDEQMLANGDTMTITQGSISIEQLIGKYIFGGISASQGQQQPPAGAQGGAPSTDGSQKGGDLPPLK